MKLDPPHPGIKPKLGPLHLGVTLRAVGSLEVEQGLQVGLGSVEEVLGGLGTRTGSGFLA